MDKSKEDKIKNILSSKGIDSNKHSNENEEVMKKNQLLELMLLEIFFIIPYLQQIWNFLIGTLELGKNLMVM